MTTATQTRRRVKTCSIRLAVPLGNPAAGEHPYGVVEITQDGQTQGYFLEPMPSDFGRAFELRKPGEVEAYHVNLNGSESLCDCKGFERWNRCKHVAGLTALMQRGKL